MSPEESDHWIRVRQARDKLAEQLLEHHEVSLIDIGYDIDSEEVEAMERIVLRVHIRLPSARETLGLPAEIDGIPICVIVADYRIE